MITEKIRSAKKFSPNFNQLAFFLSFGGRVQIHYLSTLLENGLKNNANRKSGLFFETLSETIVENLWDFDKLDCDIKEYKGFPSNDEILNSIEFSHPILMILNDDTNGNNGDALGNIIGLSEVDNSVIFIDSKMDINKVPIFELKARVKGYFRRVPSFFYRAHMMSWCNVL